jgi:hypothetical protein
MVRYDSAGKREEEEKKNMKFTYYNYGALVGIASIYMIMALMINSGGCIKRQKDKARCESFRFFFEKIKKS